MCICYSYNPCKCVLNALHLAHVETGQTPEVRVAVINTTTYQGHQDSSLVSKILFNLPEITHLNEACLTNIVNQTPRFFTTTAEYAKLPNMLTGR